MKGKCVLEILAAMIVSGCMTANGPYILISPNPTGTPEVGLEHWDKDTRYAITNKTAAGFSVFVSFVQYQFVPDEMTVGYNCREALKKVALQVASNDGMTITPVVDRDIVATFGRNGFTGNTTCIANADVRRGQLRP